MVGANTSKRKVLDLIVIVLLLAFGVAAIFIVIMAIATPKDEAIVVDTSKKSVSDRIPALNVSVILGKLDHPWEVAFLPDRTMLITERGGDISKIKDGQKVVIHHPDDVYVKGEGGLTGLAVDPDFRSNRFLYVCLNSMKPGLDIRVARFKLNDQATQLTDRQDIVAGMPASVGGRHSGCRLGFGPDGNLWIGTGDAAQASHPQDQRSLGGKILRVDRDGKGANDNLGSEDARIYSFGHRNTQGLAFYPSPKNGSYGVSIEHGPNIDDEINPLVKGNFGWAPKQPYEETVPMTDLARFPQAIKSIWSSGNPTIAPSDADFLVGERWGKWQGRLAMAVLRDKHLRLMELKDDGGVGEQLKLFDREFGRLRAVTMGLDGSLYITTDNGNNTDFVLKITPDL